MAYLTEQEVRARAARVTQRFQKSAGRVLLEATAALADEAFDVFLSHSSAEPEEILLGVVALLEDRGLSVYVDKYSDPHLSPEKVTRETAEILRYRMRCSNTLLYVYSQYSKKSRWMPWELGFFDGLKGSVGIIPVTRNQEETFRGEEYLNLYPHVDIATIKKTNRRELWITEAADTYALLDEWAKGTAKISKRAN
jgi:hypothetical protein